MLVDKCSSFQQLRILLTPQGTHLLVTKAMELNNQLSPLACIPLLLKRFSLLSEQVTTSPLQSIDGGSVSELPLIPRHGLC